MSTFAVRLGWVKWVMGGLNTIIFGNQEAWRQEGFPSHDVAILSSKKMPL
jgi:hypothetical protein